MKQKIVSVLASLAFVMAMSSANAAENPFGMDDLQQSQQVSMSSSGGKCMGSGDKAVKCSGGGKCSGSGKCGDAKKKSSKCSAEGKCSGK